MTQSLSADKQTVTLPKAVTGRIAEETGVKKSTMATLISHGRALREAAAIAGVEKSQLIKTARTREEVKAVAKIARTAVNPENEDVAKEVERQRGASLRAIASGKPTKVALKAFEDTFKSHQKKVAELQAVVEKVAKGSGVFREVIKDLHAHGLHKRSSTTSRTLWTST